MGVTASSDHSPDHSDFDDLDNTVIETPNLTDRYFDPRTEQPSPQAQQPTQQVDQQQPEQQALQPQQEQPQEEEENVAEAIARICTSHLYKPQTKTASHVVPDVYIIWVDKKLVGYKASWKATKRTVDTLMTHTLQKMPLGAYKYWWSKPKTVDNNTTRYIMFAQPYNNLINYPSTCTSITIQRIPYVHQVQMDVDPSYSFKPQFTLKTTVV